MYIGRVEAIYKKNIFSITSPLYFKINVIIIFSVTGFLSGILKTILDDKIENVAFILFNCWTGNNSCVEYDIRINVHTIIFSND